MFLILKLGPYVEMASGMEFLTFTHTLAGSICRNDVRNGIFYACPYTLIRKRNESQRVLPHLKKKSPLKPLVNMATHELMYLATRMSTCLESTQNLLILPKQMLTKKDLAFLRGGFALGPKTVPGPF
jgi:hypothetical protein